MDWAIQAARRKTHRLPGGSRSIIETLNVFNDVSGEGQKRIDMALKEANEWLNGNVLSVRSESVKLSNKEDEKSVMVSPEKTLDQSVQETEELPASGTPLRAAHELPSATPKSLADENYTEEVKPVKASPWSPYKVDKSLKGSATEEVSVPSSKTGNSRATEKWGLTEEVRTSTASDSNVTSKSLEQIVRDRSQRRSNMFVPLPSRDPLVVPLAPLVPKLPANDGSPPAQADTKLPSPPTRNAPVLKKITRTTQSPTYSSTSTRISRATSSVFDRLSSLPTKSFENKVASKFAGRRISASSSIDVTGSPIRRASPTHKNGGSTETTIQDTLKNIFFAKDRPHDAGPRLSREKPSLARSRHVDTGRVAKNIDTRGSPRSKLTRYHGPLNETNRGQLTGRNSSRALHKPDLISLKLGASHQSGSESPQRSGLAGSSTTKSPLGAQSIDKPTTEAETDIQQGATNETSRSKTKHQDRLTKFQLIPPAESEKGDLKEKLNKRLSEVMRTQQNQHRRRNDQQKRKSQLDEDFKRRTRLWNEMKETSFSVSTAVLRNNGKTPVQNNTVLHDLNTIDHRTIIGKEDESRYPTAGNQTLPEIQSDSEEEDDFTLASWAKPPYLQEQLYRQQNWDPKKIFGPIPPLHIDLIFPNTRTNKLKPLQPSPKRI